MNELEYEKALNEELEQHTDSALASINIVIDAIPEKANTFYLEVFPSQDGDGFFCVETALKTEKEETVETGLSVCSFSFCFLLFFCREVSTPFKIWLWLLF